MTPLESKHKRLELLMNKSFFARTVGDGQEIEKLIKEIKKMEKKE